MLPAYSQERFPYKQQLAAFKESLLTTDNSPNHIYRFIWLRTFNNPISVRIEKHNDDYNLYWKVTDGKGGYEPGKLVIDKQKRITKENWKKFLSLIKQVNFWNMQQNLEEPPVSDGAQWVLEGKSASLYHFVDIQSPGASSSYYKCCYFLIRLTDLTIKDSEKY